MFMLMMIVAAVADSVNIEDGMEEVIVVVVVVGGGKSRNR